MIALDLLGDADTLDAALSSSVPIVALVGLVVFAACVAVGVRFMRRVGDAAS